MGLAGRPRRAWSPRSGRLLRDISHELRSPLARLNVALGLARQRAGNDQGALDRIEREPIVSLAHRSAPDAGADGKRYHERRARDDRSRRHRHEVVEGRRFEPRAGGRAVQLPRPATRSSAAIPSCFAAPWRTSSATRSATRRGNRGGGESAPRGCGRRADPGARPRGSGVPRRRCPTSSSRFTASADARERGTGRRRPGADHRAPDPQLHDGTVRAANVAGGGLVVELTLARPADLAAPVTHTSC